MEKSCKTNWKLIDSNKFIYEEDKALMPEYEREQMANKVLSFYNRLPEEIKCPFTKDFFWEKPREEIIPILENPKETEVLLEQMDAALSTLPKDFTAYQTSYQEKADILSKLHQYAEGKYTIFPESKNEVQPKLTKNVSTVKLTIKQEIGHQMTIFDYFAANA